MSQIPSPNDPCPCDSGKKYKKCCRRYHRGQPAPSPEALVRARYAAHAIGDVDFLMATVHPESPHFGANQLRWQAQIEAFVNYNRFPSVEILDVDDNHVTYHAAVFMANYDNSFVEDAEFRQHDGAWYYYDGKRIDEYPPEDTDDTDDDTDSTTDDAQE